jgi:hypothetical protein
MEMRAHLSGVESKLTAVAWGSAGARKTIRGEWGREEIKRSHHTASDCNKGCLITTLAWRK